MLPSMIEYVTVMYNPDAPKLKNTQGDLAYSEWLLLNALATTMYECMPVDELICELIQHGCPNPKSAQYMIDLLATRKKLELLNTSDGIFVSSREAVLQ
jgi:hypothetical protein